MDPKHLADKTAKPVSPQPVSPQPVSPEPGSLDAWLEDNALETPAWRKRMAEAWLEYLTEYLTRPETPEDE